MTAVPSAEGRPRVRFTANRFVFLSSIAMVVGFVGFAVAQTGRARTFFGDAVARISRDFGSLYVVAVGAILLFCLWLGASRFGSVRLGRDGEAPEFSTLSWLSMLFGAGMGIGLLFFGVAEPILHYAAPPDASPKSIEAAREAMFLVFFHWGLHAWAIYVMVGVTLAYFHFRLGLPMSLRACLHPLLGSGLYGRAGDVLDLLGVFATLFGLATSLGLGAMQINAGLAEVFGAPFDRTTQLTIIVVVTSCATASVVSGIHAGVRRLSELTMVLAALFVLFVFTAGPTRFLVDAFVDNLGYYLGHVVPRTFLRDAYRDEDWFATWTVFYWAWWITWSPFVGCFVARISRGRTIREFVAGVLLAPTLLTFGFMTIVGNTALHQQIHGDVDLVAAVTRDTSTALFAMLRHLPLAALSAPVAALLVALFFVTSSDSGSLVVDMLTSGGDPDPPIWQRVFWALMEGGIAATLLVLGGLRALQSAVITAGLPLLLVLALMAFALVRALRAERTSSARPPSRHEPDTGDTV